MGRTDQGTNLMGMGCNLFSTEVDMGSSARFKALAFPVKQIAKLAELGKVFGKYHVMDTAFILNLDLRDDNYPGIILQEWLPSFLPVRLEGIPGAKNLNAFCHAPFQQLIRLHETGYGHRKRGVNMEVGIDKHGYYPVWLFRDIKEKTPNQKPEM
jgi:hypothetical protein